MTEIFTTWDDLSATSGTTANEGAWVYGPDSGTHTDPVSGGTADNIGVYAWSVSPAGWERVADLLANAQTFIADTLQPPTIDDGTSQVLFDFVCPDRTDGDGTHSDTHIRLQYAYSPFPADSILPGSPSLTDRVLAIGQNATGSFTPLDTSQPAFTDRWEMKFGGRSRQTGNPFVYWSERHMAFWTASNNGVAGTGEEVRLFTATLPWDTNDWKYDSGISMRAAQHTIYAGNGVDIIKVLDAQGDSPCTPVETLHARFSFAHLGNNTPWLTQHNAAGNAMLPLPFIDDHNELYVQQNIYHLITSPALNPLGIYSAHATAIGNVPSGARLRYLAFAGAGGVAPATITDLETQGAASTVVRWSIENQHATGEARLDIIGYGNQTLLFKHTASGRTGTLKLTNSGQRFEVDKPVKFPTYAVAALPAAATAGAGARAFVNDADATTFNSVVAGGGANFVPVFCDGTDWKIG
ncbi:hypothetical protein [Sphingomonas sp.]|uniref:hypothetical protein n=1 Tax=Sphingomonas sp. TaxID=28214 RepID=UPI002E316C08|nr:hypothetical protein [Sphingomonas sp.]HEX4693120.1 hypothetical protein [Sphingomonas sp.]